VRGWRRREESPGGGDEGMEEDAGVEAPAAAGR